MRPVSVGVDVVSVMSPAASASTRTEICSTSWAPPPRAVTRIVEVPAAASAGTSTSSRTSAAVPEVTATASTTNPPPSRLAVQPSGTPLRASATLAVRVESTVRSKLTFVPGATATAGKGVVTSRPSSAETAGASVHRTRIEMTSAVVARVDRAKLLRKVSLLDANCVGMPGWAGRESAKDAWVTATQVRSKDDFVS